VGTVCHLPVADRPKSRTLRLHFTATDAELRDILIYISELLSEEVGPHAMSEEVSDLLERDADSAS